MPVCKYFLSGSCRFGDRCHFDHPAGGATNNGPQRSNGGNPPRNNVQGNQSARQPAQSNRYNSLESRIEVPSGPRGNPRFGGGGGSGGGGGGGGGSNYQPHHQQGSNDPRNQRGRGFQGSQGNQNGHRRGGPQAPNNFNLTEQDIAAELNERPEWPMSCFGPGKNPPVNLWGGEIEQSPEEVRTAHYLAVANGTPEQTPIIEADMINAANNFVQNALRDPRGAINYIVDGSQQHPNRYDELQHERSKHPEFCVDNFRKRRGVFSHIPRDDPRSRQQDRMPNGFTNPQNPQQPIVGFGQSSNTGFNQTQPNAPNQQHSNAFSGQPSGSGFGQPQLGAPSLATPQQPGGFAAPQFGTPAGLNGFAQSNPHDTQMGGPTSPMGGGFMQPPSGFGQQGNPQPTNTFGQQAHANQFSQPQQHSSFGTQKQAQPAFGAPSFATNAQTTSSFGLQQSQQPQVETASTSINQQPQLSIPVQSQYNGNVGGVRGHPLPGKEHLWVDDDLHRVYAAALENGGFPVGMIPTEPPPAYFMQ